MRVEKRLLLLLLVGLQYPADAPMTEHAGHGSQRRQAGSQQSTARGTLCGHANATMATSLWPDIGVFMHFMPATPGQTMSAGLAERTLALLSSSCRAGEAVRLADKACNFKQRPRRSRTNVERELWAIKCSHIKSQPRTH